MACDNDQIKQSCGNITYAACTQYQGGVSSESDLDPINDCLSLEETTQDIYSQLDDLSSRIGNQDIQGTVTSVNDIEPDVNGDVDLTSDNIPQGSTNLYTTPTEKATWNGKQNSLGFTPVPDTRTINGNPLTSDVIIDKNDVGLGNVPNVNATIASNITQTSLYRFVTDTDIATWNAMASSGVIEITYTSLLTLKNTSALAKGKIYLITDYMTTYNQPVTSVSKTSGVTEPLYVIAVDVNKLHNVGRSKLYPQDIIYYEISGEVNGEGTEGFTKGKIYRRIDTLRNNDIGTDWRHVKYNRSGTDKLLFEDYSSCENNIIREFTLFNNVVGATFANNTINEQFLNNTIGLACVGNTIKESFTGNTIGDQFFNNRIENNFGNNVIGASFSNNKVDYFFAGNTIGVSLQNSSIGVEFLNNTVGDNGDILVFQSNIGSKNFTAADIYSKSYVNTITRKTNGNYQYSYIDGFGDTVIEDIA